MENTFWALLPPLIAIALALVTKEVLSSLLVGIIAGALFYSNFSLINSLTVMFEIMGLKIGDNASVILFLCFLGVLVVLMSKAGGSRAYGEWAQKKIKSRSGAMLATSALGAIIFVDDYFNCLTVGTVMRPVTDSHKISRAKLAYIIDSTAAPICIIAPISSWAMAVGSTIETTGIENGFSYFIQTIPFNIYAILTLISVIAFSVLKLDFGKMKKYEQNAMNGDIHSLDKGKEIQAMESVEVSSKGKVMDLVIPVVLLIVISIGAMLFTGYEGIIAQNADGGNLAVNIITLFGNANVNMSIVVAAFVTIILTMLLYLPRKIISFQEFMESVTQGIKSMVPAISILVLAWTLSGVCEYLQTGEYVGRLIEQSGISLNFLPAIIFAVAGVLAFATGTSWGTFTIMIPIVVIIFAGVSPDVMLVSISATLAGAVFGDHISPISDTTILSSTGAECNHIDHVSTQIPYATMVAGCSFITYIVAGFVPNVFLSLGIGITLLSMCIIFLKIRDNKLKKNDIEVDEA